MGQKESLILGLGEAVLVLARVACTCRGWSSVASSEHVWQAWLGNEAISSCTSHPVSAIVPSPLRVQIKATWLLAVVLACIDEFKISVTSSTVLTTALRLILQQLELSEDLLATVIASGLHFEPELAAWVHHNLVTAVVASAPEAPNKHPTPSGKRVHGAQEVLGPALDSVSRAKRQLQAKLFSIEAADHQATRRRLQAHCHKLRSY